VPKNESQDRLRAWLFSKTLGNLVIVVVMGVTLKHYAVVKRMWESVGSNDNDNFANDIEI